MNMEMFKCPKCNSLIYEDGIKNCVVCSAKLEKNNDNQTEYTISVKMDFSIYECKNCNAIYYYGAKVCSSCKEPLVYDLDPIVAKRKKILSDILKYRDNLMAQISYIKPMPSVLKEEEYRHIYKKSSDLYQKSTSSIRKLLKSINFSGSNLNTLEFKKQIKSLENKYSSLYEITKRIKKITPHPSWESIHQTFVASTEKITKSYFDIIEVLTSDSVSQAQCIMEQINQSLNSAGKELEKIGNLVIAGKKIRYGVANLPEAMTFLINEGTNLKVWQKIGFDYFREVFERDISDQPDTGFVLAIWAIIIESFNEPKLLIKRTSAITNLCRQADKINCLKSVNDRIKDDIIHASRLMYNIGQQILATDFSKLHLQQKFDIAIHTYQRLSEGAFKNLITILLYCEQIINGKNPNYDAISVKNFGAKIRYDKGGLKSSKNPLIAGLANDLIMYVRHADAHCDFFPQPDKIIINERHFSTKRIINTHKYSEQEFIDLIQKLFEAVFSIVIAIRCFQFESGKDYMPDKIEDMFDYEKIEISKYFFASKGVIVDTIDQFFSENNKPYFKLKVILSEYSEKKPDVLLTPKSSLYVLFPKSTHFITEIFDYNNNFLGTINIPTSHYKKFQKLSPNSRARELILLNLTYKTYTQYCDSPKIFDEEKNNEKLFWKYLFKGAIIYLHYILSDCYKSIALNKKETLKFIIEINQDILLLEEIVTTNNAPILFKKQYETMICSIPPVRQFVQKLKYHTKTGSKKNVKKLKLILEKSNNSSIKLIEFAKNVEKNNNISS